MKAFHIFCACFLLFLSLSTNSAVDSESTEHVIQNTEKRRESKELIEQFPEAIDKVYHVLEKILNDRSRETDQEILMIRLLIVVLILELLNSGQPVLAYLWYTRLLSKINEKPKDEDNQSLLQKKNENSELQRKSEDANLKVLLDTLNEVKNELENQKEKLDQQRKSEDAKLKVLLDTLNEVKNELENQKEKLGQQLREVESNREKNKEELQGVERKITKGDTSDGKDELFKTKERLLNYQWKLDEEKKACEKHLLNMEKALEPIEIQLTKIGKRD